MSFQEWNNFLRLDFYLCRVVLVALSVLSSINSLSQPDCLPIGPVIEIQEIQTFGKQSLGLIGRLPAASEIEIPEAKSELVKEVRKTADIDVLIGLMSGALEERWEDKLNEVSAILVKRMGMTNDFSSVTHSFNKNGGVACTADSDFYACGKLELKSGSGDIICEVELLEGPADNNQFQAPKKITFPSYALTCNKFSEEGEVILSKRAFFDPNQNIEEEVEKLKAAIGND